MSNHIASDQRAVETCVCVGPFHKAHSCDLMVLKKSECNIHSSHKREDRCFFESVSTFVFPQEEKDCVCSVTFVLLMFSYYGVKHQCEKSAYLIPDKQ